MQARDGEEREKWVHHLEDTISRSLNRYRSFYDHPQNLQSMGGSASTTGGRDNLLVQFDRKVSEADTYLQLIIDQTSKIEESIENLESPEDRQKFDQLRQQANVSWFIFSYH